MKSLIRKILIKELDIKKYKSFKPGIAIHKGKKIIVVLDENDNVLAHGPYINDDTNQNYICNVVNSLIEELFHEDDLQSEGLIRELDSRDFTNIEVINYCNSIKESSDFNPEDFDWVDTNLEPIRDRDHRVELIEDAIAKVREYKGWRISQDRFDGVVYWHGTGEYTGMATPEWSEPFQIPVDIMNQDDYDNVTEIHTPHFKYVVELQDWYNKNYFETVYKVLTDYINQDEVPGIIEMN